MKIAKNTTPKPGDTSTTTILTHITGINVIGYYQTIMYESLGFTGSKKLLVAGIYNCCGPIASRFSHIKLPMGHPATLAAY